MGAYRYWRLRLRSLASEYVVVAEAVFRTSAGGAQQATSGMMSASSSYSTKPPSAAVDGNSTTEWHPDTGGGGRQLHWLRADFGSPVTLVEILLQSRTDDNQYNPGASWVEASNDAVSWVLQSAPFTMEGMTAGATLLVPLSDVTASSVVTRRSVRAGAWPTAPLGGRLVRKTITYDVIDGGKYKIEGTVAIDDSPDIPVRRRVRLFHRLSGRLVRETVSTLPSGDYRFENIKNQPYFVVAHDAGDMPEYNAVIKDAITPEPM